MPGLGLCSDLLLAFTMLGTKFLPATSIQALAALPLGHGLTGSLIH